jgi:hypothetical protein
MIQSRLPVLAVCFLVMHHVLVNEAADQSNVTSSLDKSMIEKLSKIGRDTSAIKKSNPRQVSANRMMIDRRAEKFLIDLEEIDNFDNYVNNRNGKTPNVDLNQLNSLFNSKNSQNTIRHPYLSNEFFGKSEPIKQTRGIEQMSHIYQSLASGDEIIHDKDINTVRYIPCVKGRIKYSYKSTQNI